VASGFIPVASGFIPVASGFSRKEPQPTTFRLKAEATDDATCF
jgi:hypothetical protein